MFPTCFFGVVLSVDTIQTICAADATNGTSPAPLIRESQGVLLRAVQAMMGAWQTSV